MSRLDPQPAERIDRSKKVKFKFDGKSVSGYEGDTIASALYAGGQRIFSRSFKYHRPRGIVSASGWTANTLVQNDEWPGIRATTERAARRLGDGAVRRTHGIDRQRARRSALAW